MADRPQQTYPSMQGFNNGMNNMNNMLQQQQHNQQQQQQGGDMHPSQSFGGLWNQSMQQQQPQFRPRSGAGMPPQNQAQMNEIMRSHNMARVPSGQQQPMNFSMGVPNMGNPLPFHDQPSNQPNMNGGAFGGMQNPAMQQQRQNNLLQSMPPGNVRQLEMMMQNPTSMNFAKLRPDQPQANQQPSFPNSGVNPNPQGDLFSSPSMSNVGIRGPSPSHPPNMNMMPIMPPNGNPIQAPQRRNLTSTEVGDRTNQLRLAVANQEATYNKIKSNPAFNSSAELQQRAKQIFDDLTQKKRYLSHMMQQAMNSQGNVAGQGVNPAANGWMAPPNPNAAGRPNGPPTPIPPQSSPHPTGAAQSPSLVKPQPPGPHQAGLPQRTEATPQPPSQGPQMSHIPQQPSGDAGPSGGPFQMSGQMNTPMNGAGPGMGQPNPNGMPNGGPGGMASINSSVIAQLIASIPPLEPGTFENSFKSFCARRNRPFNPQLLTIDNRQVDLQTLHAIVIQEGGAAKIEQRGAWDVVGGKLGFVQFPGNESEPSKSGPGVALQISTMYREYLQGFDTVYLSSTLESRNKANGLGIPNVPIVAAMFTGSVAPGGMGGPGGAAAMMQARARAQAQQMGQLVPLAYLSVAEMRSKNVPEQFIVAVEQHRAMLQRAHDDQASYARGLRGPQQQPGPNNGLQQLGGPHQQQGPADAHQGNGMGPAGVQSPFGGPVQGGQGHMPNRGMPIGQNLIQGGMPNPMDRPQGSPFGQIPPASLPHQMPQQGMGQGPNPNHEQFQLAMAYISRVKTEFLNNSLPNMTSREVPPEQRVQFNATLEQLHRIMTENESKLPMFFMLLNNSDLIKKLILISCTVAHQRQLLSGGSNRHIVSLETMRNMYNEVSKIHEMCTNALRATSNRRQQQMAQQQLLQQNQMKQPHQPMQQGLGMPSPANLSGPDMQRGPVPTNLGPNIPPPPSSIPPPIGAQHTPNLANQALRTQALSLNQPPPPRRPQPQQKQVNGAPPQGISSPSPAPPANASTPTHNAPTPNTMGSPQIPKSPKVKAPVNKKPQRANQRRPSKSTPTTSGNNAPTPGSHASPETSTPVQAPATIKRPREDDQAVGPSPGPSGDNEGVANGPSPPKRPKLEPPSSSAMPPAPQLEKPGEPLKKGPEMASEVSHIKTPQQSTEFLEQMTKLLTDVSSEGQAGTSPEQFGNTLEMLLKSVGGETDVMSNGFEAFPNPPSPGGGQGLSFDDLFDFSNMAEDEDYKDTPDLIRSSSTNPSPESNNSEGDHGLPSSSVKLEPKTEDFSSDVMPSGLWKEIDGGEAAYFQSSDWKWDGQMSTVEQPWAIY